jgi:hypothetical protein
MGNARRRRIKMNDKREDWVDIQGFQTPVASIVLEGRSIPIARASTTDHVCDGHRSRNALEESLVPAPRDTIPESVKVVILADRGFGRTALAGEVKPNSAPRQHRRRCG